MASAVCHINLARGFRGAILLGDAPIQDVRPQERNVAMVFQNYALFPNLDVRDNILLPFRISALPLGEHVRSRAQELALLDVERTLVRVAHVEPGVVVPYLAGEQILATQERKILQPNADLVLPDL